MKKFLLFILLIAGAGYAYWPYHVAGKFQDAINADATGEMDKLVDFPALRTDLRTQFLAVAEKTTRERFGDKAAEMMKSDKLAGIIDKGLEVSITPANLPKMAKERPGKNAVKEVAISSRTWISQNEFHITFADDPTVMRFKLTGMDGWKLVGLKFDEKAVQALMNPGNRPAPVTAAGTPSAPLTVPIPEPPKVRPAVPPGYTSPLDQRPPTERRAPPDARPLR